MKLRKRVTQLLFVGIIIVFFILTTGLTPVMSQNSWTTKASMSEPKREIMSSEFNGRIYVFGGYYPDHRKHTVEEYNPVANTWTTKTPMPTARDAGISAVVNGKIYVIGGYNAPNRLNVVEEYDPANDTWTNCGAQAPSNGCSPMPTPRNRLAGAVVDGKIYAIGGESDASNFRIVEAYDPATNTWTTKTSLPTWRTQITSSVVNGKIYVFGSGGGAHNAVDEYDPATNTWTNCGGSGCAPMPTGRVALTSSVVNEKIYVIGGDFDVTSYYDTVEEYDPATNTWTNCGGSGCTPMPTARRFLASSVVNEKIYAIGGQAYENIHLSTVEEYTPPTVNPPFTVSSASISLDKSSVEQNETITGDGTISGSGRGTVKYHWIVRKPGGIWFDSGELSTTMTNGTAQIPSYSGFPTDIVGSYSTFVRVTSPVTLESSSQDYVVTEQLTWYKYAGNPVLDVGASGSWEDAGVSSPHVLLDNGVYQMWYAGCDPTCRIGYATSMNGTSWTKHGYVLDVGAPGAWDDGSLNGGHSVVLDGGVYKMWYGASDGSIYRIGYATSSDGTTWTKHGYVLDVGTSGGWEDSQVLTPTVLLVNGNYRMWYAGRGPKLRIGYAVSSDGIHWTKYPNNPVLDVTSGAWDFKHVLSPSVVLDGGVYKMWYTGSDGVFYRIGYATTEPIQNQSPVAKITMTSGSQTAYENQTLNLTVPPGGNAQVDFSASQSSDPDGSITGYKWSINGNQVSTSSNFSQNLGAGTYQISLTVTDNQGAEGSAGASIVVTEQTPITLTCADSCCVQLENNQHQLVKGDFTLTFDPSEPSSYTLTFDPPVVSMPWHDLTMTREETVTVDAGPYGSVQDTLTLVNPDSKTVIDQIHKIVKKLEELGKVLDIITKFSQAAPGGGCDTSVFSAEINSGLELSKMCCPDFDQCVLNKIKGSAGGSFDVGSIACDFPFLGIPYVATLNVTFNAGLSGSLTISGETTCSNSQFCGSLNPNLTVGGGVSGILIHKALARAALTLQTSADIHAELCYKEKWVTTGKGCLSAEVVGEVTVFSLVTKKVSASIIKDECMPFW